MRVQGQGSSISAPQIIVVSNTVVSCFATNASRSDGRSLLRTIQNTGTNAVLYALGTNNVTTGSYHGVIAGGAATRDGLGSILNVSSLPAPVALVTEGGVTTVAIVEIVQ